MNEYVTTTPCVPCLTLFVNDGQALRVIRNYAAPIYSVRYVASRTRVEIVTPFDFFAVVSVRLTVHVLAAFVTTALPPFLLPLSRTSTSITVPSIPETALTTLPGYAVSLRATSVA